MASRFSIQDRAQCACWFNETKSITMVQRRFRKGKEHCIAPSRKSILKWHASLFTTGSILDKKRAKSFTVRTEEMSNAIVGAVEANPNISLRRLSVLFSVPLTSVHRILQAADLAEIAR
jgi:hypothetical protein